MKKKKIRKNGMNSTVEKRKEGKKDHKENVELGGRCEGRERKEGKKK